MERTKGNGARIVSLENARFVLRRRKIVPVLDARVTNLDRSFDDSNAISTELDTRWPSLFLFQLTPSTEKHSGFPSLADTLPGRLYARIFPFLSVSSYSNHRPLLSQFSTNTRQKENSTAATHDERTRNCYNFSARNKGFSFDRYDPSRRFLPLGKKSKEKIRFVRKDLALFVS